MSKNGELERESQLVQLFTLKEHVRQGLEHPTHTELIKNLVLSTQLRHNVAEEQLAHGERQGMQEDEFASE